MVKDFEGNSNCYDLQKCQYIQGLVAKQSNKYRGYIVTLEPEIEDAYIHSQGWFRMERSPSFLQLSN
jgi:hypothetical protein